MSCLGCGLRENGVTSDLEVATSEEFGSGVLAGFGSDDTVGEPVYCDSAQQLRTAPGHTSSTGEDEASVGSQVVGAAATVNGATATLILNNPSAVRAASVMVAFSSLERFDWSDADSHWTSLFTALRNSLAYFTLPMFQAPNNAGPMAWTQAPSVTTVDTIAAGGSVTYALQDGVTTAGDTSGNMTSTVAIRALAVTV